MTAAVPIKDNRTPAPAALRPTWPAVWVGLFGGHVAWTLHLLLSYFAVAMTCHAGDPGDLKFHLVQHSLTVVLAVVAIASGVIAFRTWRRVKPLMRSRAEPAGTQSGGDPGEALRAAGRVHHLAVLGISLDAFFLVAILFGGAANFYVPACL